MEQPPHRYPVQFPWEAFRAAHRRWLFAGIHGRLRSMHLYEVAQLDQLPSVPCPCGSARRAFRENADAPASVHLVEIKADAATHHHQRTTEIYVVLEGQGHLELDGHRVPVKPLTAVVIRPGCRHRAIGRLKILNIPIPPFDPQDEFLD